MKLVFVRPGKAVKVSNSLLEKAESAFKAVALTPTQLDAMSKAEQRHTILIGGARGKRATQKMNALSGSVRQTFGEIHIPAKHDMPAQVPSGGVKVARHPSKRKVSI